MLPVFPPNIISVFQTGLCGEVGEYQRNKPPYLITVAKVITCSNQPNS